MGVQEAAKGGSTQHVLQLEHVQLRSQLEEEGRERRSAQEATAGQLRTMQERLDAAGQDARSSLQALDSDMCSLRTNAERQLGAQAASIEQAKARLLQCAQAIEKQWSTSKVQQQRLESLSSSGALQNQQLHERVEVINKQQTRWRASIEDAVKATAADVQLVQAQCRALENAIGSAKADARRLVGEHETETQVRRPAESPRPRSAPAAPDAAPPPTPSCAATMRHARPRNPLFGGVQPLPARPRPPGELPALTPAGPSQSCSCRTLST